MAFYECVLLIKSNLSDEEIASVLAKFQNLVVSREGTVHHVQKMGKRRLSYELKKSAGQNMLCFLSNSRSLKILQNSTGKPVWMSESLKQWWSGRTSLSFHPRKGQEKKI